MPDRARPYRSFLLRLWHVQDDGSPIWRASLECSETGKRYSFAGLDALFAYLSDVTGGRDGETPHRDNGVAR